MNKPQSIIDIERELKHQKERDDKRKKELAKQGIILDNYLSDLIDKVKKDE